MPRCDSNHNRWLEILAVVFIDYLNPYFEKCFFPQCSRSCCRVVSSYIGCTWKVRTNIGNEFHIKGKVISVTGRRGFHIFSRQSAHRRRWGCQPYAPATLLPPGRFLVLICVRGWVDSSGIVLLEGLGQLKNPMRPHRESNSGPSGLYHSASNQLRYRVPHPTVKKSTSTCVRKLIICELQLKEYICNNC
jgi:hypothetical protein